MPVTLADLVDGVRVKHVKSGGWYRIVGVATVEATMELVVIYRADRDGRLWTRPIGEFLDGRFALDATPTNPDDGEVL